MFIYSLSALRSGNVTAMKNLCPLFSVESSAAVSFHVVFGLGISVDRAEVKNLSTASEGENDSVVNSRLFVIILPCIYTLPVFVNHKLMLARNIFITCFFAFYSWC